MSVPLLQPNFASLQPALKKQLKENLDMILKRQVSMEKVATVYMVFASRYQHWVINRRKAASKKAAKKHSK